MKANLVNEVSGKGLIRIHAMKGGKVLRTIQFRNLIMANRTGGEARGFALIMDALTGVAGSIEITKAQLGTGTTAVSENDTALATLAVDNILKSTAVAGNKDFTLQFFAASADVPNGTYKEISFMIGTKLYARALIPDPFYVKGTGEDTLIEYVNNYSNDI